MRRDSLSRHRSPHRSHGARCFSGDPCDGGLGQAQYWATIPLGETEMTLLEELTGVMPTLNLPKPGPKPRDYKTSAAQLRANKVYYQRHSDKLKAAERVRYWNRLGKECP